LVFARKFTGIKKGLENVLTEQILNLMIKIIVHLIIISKQMTLIIMRDKINPLA